MIETKPCVIIHDTIKCYMGKKSRKSTYKTGITKFYFKKSQYFLLYILCTLYGH